MTLWSNLTNDIIIKIMSYAATKIDPELKNEIINFKYNKFLKHQLLIHKQYNHYLTYETFLRMKIVSAINII